MLYVHPFPAPQPTHVWLQMAKISSSKSTAPRSSPGLRTSFNIGARRLQQVKGYAEGSTLETSDGRGDDSIQVATGRGYISKDDVAPKLWPSATIASDRNGNNIAAGC